MGLPESRAADVPCCIAGRYGPRQQLTRRGMRTILTIGVPKAVSLEAHPIVVALKSRTIPADQAVALSAHQGIGMQYCIVRKTN
jgi:hypothetical protein